MFRRCREKRLKVSFRDSVLMVKRVVLRETDTFGPPASTFQSPRGSFGFFAREFALRVIDAK